MSELKQTRKSFLDYFRRTKTESLNITPQPLYEGTKQPEAKIVKSQFIREMPKDVTFLQLINYHDRTPQVRIAVSSYAELITGTEMVITSEDDAATDLLNEWVRRTNFYDKFENMVITNLICGNSILEKLSESDTENVQEVDMTTILAKKRTPEGELEWYEQRQNEGQIVKLGEGNLERFIEFNLTKYSQQAWGRSLFYPLAVPRTTGNRTMPPFIEIMWAAEDAMAANLVNNSYPITTITYPGANDIFLKKEQEKWTRYKPGDKRVQKIKPEIEFFEAGQTAGRQEPQINHLEKTFELGTQFPHDIMTGDFTSRASSETTETIVMKLVRGYQRYLCDKLKQELFEPILEQNGFKSEDIELEISFTSQNVVELEPAQVLDIRRNGDMTRKEYRDWLRNNTGMELDAKFDEEDPEQMELQKQAAQQDSAMQKKVDGLESKISQLAQNKEFDGKLAEIQETINRKMEMLKQAKEDNDKSLFKRREKVLERMLRKAESIG
jgi:hypothetical protein